MGPYTELFRDGSWHSSSEMGPYTELFRDGSLHWTLQRWVLTLNSSEMGPYTELFRDGSLHWTLRRWVLTLSSSEMGPYTELFGDFYLSDYSWLDLPKGWPDVWYSDWFPCLQANKFDGSNVTVIQRTYTQPFDVKIFHPLRQPKGTLDDQTSNSSFHCLTRFFTLVEYAVPHPHTCSHFF